MTPSPSTSADPRKEFIFHIVWIEHPTSISVATTQVPCGSQEPSLKLTLIGAAADRVAGQGPQKQPCSLLGVHASSLMDEETQATACWTCPCHSRSVKTEDNSTFEPPLPSSTAHCRLCAHHLPPQVEPVSGNSKAVPAWLSSVMHTRQVQRGSQRDSAVSGVMTGAQAWDAREAHTPECTFQPKEAPHTRVIGIILGSTIAHSQ